MQDSQAEAAPPVVNALEQIQNTVEVIPEQSDQTAHLGYRTARKAVLEALSQKTTLLMEVTPGGIDYTPALLPVLEWLSDASIETQPGSAPQRLLIACSNQQNA